MSLDEILEYQKQCADKLGEMVSQLSDEDLRKIGAECSVDKEQYIAGFNISVTRFYNESNGILFRVDFGQYDADLRRVFNKFDFNYSRDDGWIKDSGLSHGEI